MVNVAAVAYIGWFNARLALVKLDKHSLPLLYLSRPHPFITGMLLWMAVFEDTIAHPLSKTKILMSEIFLPFSLGCCFLFRFVPAWLWVWWALLWICVSFISCNHDLGWYDKEWWTHERLPALSFSVTFATPPKNVCLCPWLQSNLASGLIYCTEYLKK